MSQAQKQETKEFLEFSRLHFEGQDHEEIKSRSKKLKDHLRLNQDWSPLKHFDPQISDQYASYTHYQKSFPKMKDITRIDEADDFPEQQRKNRAELYDRLDARLLEKRRLPMKKTVDEAKDAMDLSAKRILEKEKRNAESRKRMFPETEGKLPPLSSELARERQRKLTMRNALFKRSSAHFDTETKDENIGEKLPEGLLEKTRLLKVNAKEDKREKEKAGEEEDADEKSSNLEKKRDTTHQDSENDEVYDENSSDLGKDEEAGSTVRNSEFSPANADGSRASLAAKQLLSFKKTKFMDPLIDEYDRTLQRYHHTLADDMESDEEVLNPFNDEEDYNEDSLIDPKSEILYGRMSPWAKEELFRLFLQGWTVRDLSLRYGILPERVKAIVWMRKQFYNEIFHHLDIKTIRLGLEAEILYGMSFPWVDYGLDIQELVQRERGVPLMNFGGTKRAVDTKAWEDKERNTKHLQRILQEKTKKKHDQVIEGFVGKGAAGYLLKSWIVYKGHGSERVNRAFKRAVHDSERRHRLSHNMQKRVHKGPRYVAMTHGVK